MPVNSWVDHSLIVDMALPELSGAIKSQSLSLAALVFAEFCNESQCFREWVTVELDGRTDAYTVVTPHADHLVIGLDRVQIDGTDCLPGDYTADSTEEIVFPSGESGTAKLLVILKPKSSATNAPEKLLERWSDSLSTGLKARMMLMPEKPWTNPQLGGHYKNEFERSKLQALADVRNEFSVSRRGRSHRSQSYYY